jgi:hypothetical protein
VAVSHGVHRPADDDSRTTELAAWQLVLPPSGRFTHLTAAEQHGWWLPPLPEGLPVLVTVSRAESRPQRAGLTAMRVERPAPHVAVDGLRLDPPDETLLACARHLSLLDLVVLVDAALHLGSVSRAELERAAARRRRGAPMLRRALALSDHRSESAWETLLRLLHVTCEVAVQPQYSLRDPCGTEIARADLWVEGTNAVHEYDGEHHLERRRQRKDLARARRIGNEVWVRRGYTNLEVLHQASTVLRDADLSLGREHRPERVRRWYALLAESAFTPHGRRLLLDRVSGTSTATGDERQLHSA